MRITKDPEERRQEIIETAMLLFYENGYEKHRLEILRRQSEWHRDYVSFDLDDGRCALYLCWHRIRPLSGKSLLYYHDADQRKRNSIAVSTLYVAVMISNSKVLWVDRMFPFLNA